MNPIKRVPLIVSGGDNEVIIEIMNIDDGELREIQDIRQGLSRRDEQVRTQNSLILQLRRELAEARADAERQITVARRMMARMNKTLSRLSHRPGVYSARLRRRRRRSTMQLPAVNRGSNVNINSRNRIERQLRAAARHANRRGADGRRICPNCRRSLCRCAGRLLPNP
jgi:hypothetical protein